MNGFILGEVDIISKRNQEISEANIKQKEQLHEYDIKNENLSKKIVNINGKKEEASRLSFMFTNQLNDREFYYERLKSEVASLRQDIEWKNK